MLHRKPRCSDTLKSKLTKATGLPPKRALLKLLRQEQTIKGTAQRLQVNRNAIYQALSYYGLERQPYSHSKQMRGWYRQHPDRKPAILKPAHDAVRGVKFDHAHQVKLAIGRQTTCKIWPNEQRVIDLVHQHGLTCVPQMAVDIYNIDVALPALKIALEVNGGHWHTAPKKAQEDRVKREYLESLGWHVVYFSGKPHQIQQAAQHFIETLPRVPPP